MASQLEQERRMSGGWLRTTGALLADIVCVGLATTAHAATQGPGPEFTMRTDADDIFTSPDKQIRIEQYYADKGDEGFLYQFWTFDDKRQHPSLLNPGENLDFARYPAGFR